MELLEIEKKKHKDIYAVLGSDVQVAGKGGGDDHGFVEKTPQRWQERG